MAAHASAVRCGGLGILAVVPQFTKTPVTPPVKLGGNSVTTMLAVHCEREVLSILHPMVMGFDGMAHILHSRLMTFHRKLQLRTLMNNAFHFEIDKVVQHVVKGWVQIHVHGYTPGDICSVGYTRPFKKASRVSTSFSRVFSMVSNSPASLDFSSSKPRWNKFIAVSSDFR